MHFVHHAVQNGQFTCGPSVFLWPPSAAFAGGISLANQKLPVHQYLGSFLSGGATRNRTGDEGFADLCLTAWLWRHIPLLCSGAPRYAFAFNIHWKTGITPVFQWSGKRGSNPPPQPWQGCALPNELFPQWCLRVESNHNTGIFSPLLYQLSYRGKNGDPKGARTPDLQRDRLAY